MLQSSKRLCPDLKFDNISWEDVVEQVHVWVDEAKSTDKAKEKKSKFRKWIRDGESEAVIGKRILEALPDEKGLKVLRVGICYIFQVSGLT